MLPYRDSALTKIALVVFFLIIIGYAYFEAQGILFGPSIQVSQSIEEVSNPYIELTGTTTHIASLTMNGQRCLSLKRARSTSPTRFARLQPHSSGCQG